MIKLH